MSLLGSRIFDSPRELVTAAKLYNRFMTAVGPALTQRLGDQNWIAPTLGSGWVNSGGSNAPAGYRIRDGLLELRGTIKNGTASGTVPVIALPAAYIPDSTATIFIAPAGPGLARIDLRGAAPTGVFVTSYANSGSNAAVSLDGIVIPMGIGINPSNSSFDPTLSVTWPWPSSPIPNGMTAHAVAWYLKVFHPVDQTLDWLDADDTGWTNLNLLNSWVPFGSPWAVPQWRLRRGQVYLRGLMASGTIARFSDVPLGTRPRKNVTFNVAAAGFLGRIQVGIDGVLSVIGYAYGGSNTWVSLSGASWEADARLL